MKKNLLGFTLIELLIVIALLGTLAVALLAALDPLEQIRKGTDTGIRNTVAEIHGGAIRYSALKGGVLPFRDESDPTKLHSGEIDWFAGSTDKGSAFIQEIIDSGELKTDFIKLAGTQLSRIFINGKNGDPATDYKVTVCYKPEAKSFRMDNNTKISTTNADGIGEVVEQTTAGDVCPATAGTTPNGIYCYWCVR